MRYRLRTLVLIVAGSAAPIYAGCEGWKAGCLVPILKLWAVFFVGILVMVGLSTRSTSIEDLRERVIALYGASLIIGYFVCIYYSMLVISHHQVLATLRPPS